MAKISKLIENGIYDEFVQCDMCGGIIQSGGMWSGENKRILVCGCDTCVKKLVDLLIDTLEDSSYFSEIESNDKFNYIGNMIENRLLVKEVINKKYNR